MRWIDILKIYNLKQIKKEKLVFLITAISIFIASSISLIIPQINLENERYIDENIRKINGGDLSVNVRGNISEDFLEKLKDLDARGYKVFFSNSENCYYEKDSNRIMGTIVVGDYDLKEDEIILNGTLANNLNLKIGDKLELDTQGNGKYKFKVKEIEPLPSAVDKDAELLGYGKIKDSENFKSLKGRTNIYIEGYEGEKLKEELFKINRTNGYLTIKDKRQELKDMILIQNISLGVLNVAGYVFSILAIVSISFMLITKRKRDIAILKTISIDEREIIRAMRLEISLWILPGIILSGIVSYYGSKYILESLGIISIKLNFDAIKIILKGILVNVISFIVLINISLSSIKGISAVDFLREDYETLKISRKKAVIRIAIFIPVVFIVYSLVLGELENLGSFFMISLFVGSFLGLIAIFIKILSVFKFKNPIIMYSFKSIRKRLSAFIIILLSITLTLWFVLLGFNLEKSIKNNFTSALEDELPYNYYIKSEDNGALEKVLNSDKNIEGYIKSYSIAGIIKNQKFNDMYRAINISEVNKGDYGLNYKIDQGINLFHGENGLLISDEMMERSRLKVGDILEIETEKGIIKGKIKGSYKCKGINTMEVYKENVEFAKDISYLVKAKNSSFVDKIKESTVLSLSHMGDRMGANIAGFLKTFRILSIICLLGTILFNINIVYMISREEERDYEILKVIGYNNKFIIKGYMFRVMIIGGFSCILSLGVYSLIIKLFFKLVLNSMGRLSSSIVYLNFILAIVSTSIIFIIAIKMSSKSESIDLLKEGI